MHDEEPTKMAEVSDGIISGQGGLLSFLENNKNQRHFVLKKPKNKTNNENEKPTKQPTLLQFYNIIK